jgi:hypothetical protein
MAISPKRRAGLDMAQQQFAALRRDQRQLDAAGQDGNHVIAFIAPLENHRSRGPFAIGRKCCDRRNRLLVEFLENRKGTPEGWTLVDFAHLLPHPAYSLRPR